MNALLSACLATALLCFVVARARVPRQEVQEQEGADLQESELAHHMEAIEDGVRSLRKELKDESSWPAALATLAEVQRLSLACKLLAPETARALPEAERAALVRAYRGTMVEFLRRQLELEDALLVGDAAAVQGAFERLREMEDSSHERFAPEDE